MFCSSAGEREPANCQPSTRGKPATFAGGAPLSRRSVCLGQFSEKRKNFLKMHNLPVDEAYSIDIFRPIGGWFYLPFIVSEVQSTPNPNATKYVLDRPISQSPVSFFDAASAKDHPVASRLFAIGGVSGVLLLGDFVTVNKTPDARWAEITARVKRVLGSI